MPYDCDGSDTVSAYNSYNSYMDSNYQAGDTDCAGAESCSRGVCCSGFVSRVWQLSSHYHTWELPDVSWQLESQWDLLRGDIMNKPYDHVALFASFYYNGINVYESTRQNSYDRVVCIWRPWTDYSGYVPRRYNDVCP